MRGTRVCGRACDQYSLQRAHKNMGRRERRDEAPSSPPRVNLKREWVDAAVRVGDTAEEGEGQGRGGDIAGETRTGRVMLKAKGEEG